MQVRDEQGGSFSRFGPPVPASPLIVSVPHAGQVYPAALLAASALRADALAALEDRLADRLAADLPGLGATLFVARHARAWIDLNRDEREIDPAMIAPTPRPGRLLVTARVRGGLGLVPRRIAGMGDIYRRRLSEAEVRARIVGDHAPWHEAIAGALAAAHARFGIACLLDLHSMPPLPGDPNGEPPPRIVIGDRNGQSCSGPIADRLRSLASEGCRHVALNRPYAGAYTLERHGRPAAGIHAVQVEIDRSLYLSAGLRSPGDGLAATQALVTKMAAGLRDLLAAAAAPPHALAAE